MGKNLGGSVMLFLVPKIVETIITWAAKEGFPRKSPENGFLRNPKNRKNLGTCYAHITHSNCVLGGSLKGHQPNTKSRCYALGHGELLNQGPRRWCRSIGCQ